MDVAGVEGLGLGLGLDAIVGLLEVLLLADPDTAFLCGLPEVLVVFSAVSMFPFLPATDQVNIKASLQS